MFSSLKTSSRNVSMFCHRVCRIVEMLIKHQNPPSDTQSVLLCGDPRDRIILFLVSQVRDRLEGVSHVHNKQLLACLVLASLREWAASFKLHMHRPQSWETSLTSPLQKIFNGGTAALITTPATDIQRSGDRYSTKRGASEAGAAKI